MKGAHLQLHSTGKGGTGSLWIWISASNRLETTTFQTARDSMLRRRDDRESDVQERVVDIPLSNNFRDDLNAEEIQHPLHVVGVKKIEGAIR